MFARVPVNILNLALDAIVVFLSQVNSHLPQGLYQSLQRDLVALWLNRSPLFTYHLLRLVPTYLYLFIDVVGKHISKFYVVLIMWFFLPLHVLDDLS